MIDIDRLFLRRPFNENEKKIAKQIYETARLFSLEITRKIPKCDENDMAIRKIHEAMAYVEAAISMNPGKIS